MGDRDLLGLLGTLQLGDTFFPSGLYTLSHGLESFVQSGLVDSVEALEEVVEDYLIGVCGPGDAVATAEATRAAAADDVATLVLIDQHLHATKLAAEAAVSSCRTGRRLIDLASRLSDQPTVAAYRELIEAGQSPGTYPVSLGVLAAAWGLAPEEAAAAELYSFVTGLLGAALRVLRIDHAQVQALLVRLRPLVAATAAEAARMSYEDLAPCAPQIDIMQMRHAHASIRLFAS
jgi:urease accessory protein